MHCEWASLEQLERDKRIHQKMKRFKTKHAQMRNLFQEVRPDKVEIEQIFLCLVSSTSHMVLENLPNFEDKYIWNSFLCFRRRNLSIQTMWRSIEFWMSHIVLIKTMER